MSKMPSNKELGIKPTAKDHYKADQLIKQVLDAPRAALEASVICPPLKHPEIGELLKVTMQGELRVFKVIEYLGHNEFALEEDLTALTGAALLLQQGAA